VHRESEAAVRVTTAHDSEGAVFDHVVSTIPAWRLAELTRKDDAALATTLDRIPFGNMVTVNVHYATPVLPFDAFGFLVPTTERNADILGVVFDSAVFPEQSQGPGTRLTVMLGGHAFARVFGDKSVPETATAASLDALRRLGITASPIHTYVKHWPRCMPQYVCGHPALCRELETHVAGAWHGRLHLAGNSFYGAGVNDTVVRSNSVADLILRL
jgi:oxygen-dependent protoporphyrinogen oxidase